MTFVQSIGAMLSLYVVLAPLFYVLVKWGGVDA